MATYISTKVGRSIAFEHALNRRLIDTTIRFNKFFIDVHNTTTVALHRSRMCMYLVFSSLTSLDQRQVDIVGIYYGRHSGLSISSREHSGDRYKPIDERGTVVSVCKRR